MKKLVSALALVGLLAGIFVWAIRFSKEGGRTHEPKPPQEPMTGPSTQKIAATLAPSPAAQSESVTTLYQNDPEKTVQMLLRATPASLPDNAFYYAASGERHRMKYENAMNLAGMIQDQEKRNRALELGLEAWLAYDYASAVKWAIDSSMPVEIVAKRIMERQDAAPTTYEGQMLAIDAMAVGLERTNRRALALVAWSQASPSAALQWIDAHSAQLSSSELKQVLPVRERLINKLGK
jgi:hypothetical protein